MPGDASSTGGFDALPTREEFKDFLKQPEVRDVISERESLARNAYNVAEKLKIALLAGRSGMNNEQARQDADRLVRTYIDELAAHVNEGLKKDGERIIGEFLALSKTVPAEIRNAIDKAKAVNPDWYDMHEPVFEKIIGHFAPPSSLVDGKFEEGPPAPRGESYLVSNGYLNRPAPDGRLVQADWEELQKVHAAPGTPEHEAVQVVLANMRKLQDMDPLNLSFIRSTPMLRPGARFTLSFFLAGASLISFLIATKTKRLPKKGILALGLLLYLNRNRDTKLAFLSGPRYAALTKELRGSDAGGKVFEALGDKSNKAVIKEFVTRERKRFSLPVDAREGFPSADESYQTLATDLAISAEGAEKLRKMSPQEIDELSGIASGFGPEEMDAALQFVRRNIDVPTAVASLPLGNPAAGITPPPAR